MEHIDTATAENFRVGDRVKSRAGMDVEPFTGVIMALGTAVSGAGPEREPSAAVQIDGEIVPIQGWLLSDLEHAATAENTAGTCSPGPWGVGESVPETGQVRDAKGRGILYPSSWIDGSEAQANALLAAAAPELLEALESLHKAHIDFERARWDEENGPNGKRRKHSPEWGQAYGQLACVASMAGKLLAKIRG